ncbi:MAG: phosphoesterase [Legionellales bacterium]|nr:phosphoesterase [Legionellales bacterium]
MIDLSIRGTNNYWISQEDQNLFKIITFIESVETWTLGGIENIENELSKLSEQIDNLSMMDIGDLEIEDEIIKIISSIKFGRNLRILQILDQYSPGFSSRLISYAEDKCEKDTDHYGIFLKRNLTFERIRLASRIFSKDRFQKIIQAVEE